MKLEIKQEHIDRARKEYFGGRIREYLNLPHDYKRMSKVCVVAQALKDLGFKNHGVAYTTGHGDKDGEFVNFSIDGSVIEVTGCRARDWKKLKPATYELIIEKPFVFAAE